MIREALQNEVNVMIKSSPADLVTVTDQNVEKMLLSSIKEKYPSHRYFLHQFKVIKLSLGGNLCTGLVLCQIVGRFKLDWELD